MEGESFGQWLRHRRRALDLTQEELARQVGCARITVRKIEADQLRPSKQMAELLAEHLRVTADEREHFVRLARRGEAAELVLEAQPRDNLPHSFSSFVGREREIADLSRLIGLHRLVTLTGAGGCGKSRLAIETARQLLDSFPDGAWFATFAPLTDPHLVHQAIASALRVKEDPARPLVETLCTYLRSKHVLLVFDNCEHLIGECAGPAETLLQACAHLHILATSREALQIPGEEQYYVPCLSVPEAGTSASVASLDHFEAVRLFVDRGALAQPAFGLTAANSSSVVQICQRLDGMPLAIELAAARVKVLSVQHIAEHLDDRFNLLTGGNRTALPRHQTLRASIEWSHGLLPETTRVLFRRLSVFAGSFSPDAARAVCSDEAMVGTDVLDELSHLVDQSLVEVMQAGEDKRYRLLETIRQYAMERLKESGEGDRVRDRHLQYLTEWIEKAEPKLRGPEQLVWWDRIEIDHDNIRAALEWAMSGGDAQLGLRLAGAAFWFWYPRGYGREGLKWLKAALGGGPAHERTAARAKALVQAAWLAARMYTTDPTDEWFADGLAIWEELGDEWWLSYSYSRMAWRHIFLNEATSAVALFEKALEYARAVGDSWILAWALRGLGAAIERSDYAAARPILEEGLKHARAAGDRELLAHTLDQLADVAAYGQHDYARAEALTKQALSIYREIGQKDLVVDCIAALGGIALAQGYPERAREHLQEALALSQNTIDPANSGLYVLELGCVADAEGQPQRAAVLLVAGESILHLLGTTSAAWPWIHAEYQQALTSVQAQLGEAEFNKAAAQGKSMTVEQAVAYALQTEEEDQHGAVERQHS